jgi:hypothetical protein
MLQFDVPQKYNGHKCAIHIELFCNSGDWKQDWHFEGWSVVVNQTKHLDETQRSIRRKGH